MYSSGYSKYSPPAQKKMAYRSKGKSCGYYMRIVFFFSSLIQSLIIVSLVLFLIYGKKQDSASISRIQDLEESFSRLSIENVALRSQRKNLTTLLNSTMTEKARNDWDLAQLRHVCNISMGLIQDMDKKMQVCNTELIFCKSSQRQSGHCPTILQDRCNCGMLTEHLNARLQLEISNFTQTTRSMRMEIEQITKDRDNHHLEVIRLRRDKSVHEKEVEFLKHRCKTEFSLSLSGVSNVTKAFLEKIESLFPTHIAFQLSCQKQKENLEQIRSNCTSLSKDVEDKFQSYLNNVGNQVSNIISDNSGLKAENLRLSEDYRKCTQNRTGLIEQHRKDLETMQEKHGKVAEKLLVDKFKLIGENEVLTKSIEYRTKMAEHLAEQVKQLNMSCMSRGGFNGLTRASGPQTSSNGWGLFGGGGGSSSSASSSSGIGQPSRTGTSSSLGSFGSPFNKPVSTGAGSSSSSFSSSGSSSSSGSPFNKPVSTGAGSSSSSLSSFGSSSSTGSLFNKPVSTGTGSSSTSLLSSGSSSSSGSLFSRPASTGTGSSSTSLSSSASSSSAGSLFNKPGSTGGAFSSLGSAGSNPSLSSSGTGLNKPALSGRGSSTTGLSSGSSGSSSSLSSSGIGLNKPTSSVKSSSAFGSSSGSTGSTTKSGSSSSGFSWLGFGNSNSGQSKTGSGTGKGTSSSSYGGTGSTFGGGRTSGLGGGSGVSVSQHLLDLHRLINPANPDERQDLSRVMG